MRKTKNSQVEEYICKTYRNEFYRKILRERFINDQSYVGILLKYDPVYQISSDGVRRHKEKRLRLFCQKFYEKMAADMEVKA